MLRFTQLFRSFSPRQPLPIGAGRVSSRLIWIRDFLLPSRHAFGRRAGFAAIFPGAEVLEDRMLLTTPDGMHDVEVLGRADDGSWISAGFDAHLNENSPLAPATMETATFQRWNPGVRWVDVKSGDFDGDGLGDVAGRDPGTGNWYVSLSDGIG